MNERSNLIQECLPWVYAVALSLWGSAVHIAQRINCCGLIGASDA